MGTKRATAAAATIPAGAERVGTGSKRKKGDAPASTGQGRRRLRKMSTRRPQGIMRQETITVGAETAGVETAGVEAAGAGDAAGTGAT